MLGNAIDDAFDAAAVAVERAPAAAAAAEGPPAVVQPGAESAVAGAAAEARLSALGVLADRVAAAIMYDTEVKADSAARRPARAAPPLLPRLRARVWVAVGGQASFAGVVQPLDERHPRGGSGEPSVPRGRVRLGGGSRRVPRRGGGRCAGPSPLKMLLAAAAGANKMTAPTAAMMLVARPAVTWRIPIR